MKKRKMMGSGMMTFREGCEAYLLNCRQRNLREATINHYRQSYTQFYKQIDPETPLSRINKAVYDGYVQHLLDTLDNDVSVNSYEDGVLTVQSIGGYDVYYNDFTTYAFTYLTEGAGVWSGEIPQTAEQFAADGGWMNHCGENWQALYDTAGQLTTVSVSTDDGMKQIEVDLDDDPYVQVYHADADGFRVWTMYDPATGKVKNQNSEIYESDCTVNIVYDADGVLQHIYCHSSESVIYCPNEGWFDMSNNPVDAPALLADKTALEICAMLPCTFTEATVPAPSPKVSIPEFTVRPKTFRTLAETGIPVEKIRAGIPEPLEIEVINNLLFIRDIDETAFGGCTDLVIFAEDGSEADAFAEENGFGRVLR